MKKNANPTKNYRKAFDVSQIAKVDTNATVMAKGNIVDTKSGTLNTAIGQNTAAHNSAIAATDNMHIKNDDAVAAFNVMAATYEIEYPGNESKWKAAGFDTTKAIAYEVEAPSDAPTGCSAVRTLMGGEVSIHCHPIDGADEYLLFETQDANPADASKYYQAVPRKFTSSHGGTAVVKVAGAKCHWKLQAANGGGEGPMSDPFGGFTVD